VGLSYSQSIAGCLSGAIGSHGLGEEEFESWLQRVAPALEELKDAYRTRSSALLRIAEETVDLPPAEAALAKLSADAHTIIFFGTGGSSLGGQTLAQLGGWNIPGTTDRAQKLRPRTRFYDNLDPLTLAGAFASLDLASTRFVVISKSGETPETLAQAVAALAAVQSAGLGAQIPRLFLGITEPKAEGRPNGLRTLFEARDIPLLDHPPTIGGRFSVFTIVGLLPAMARGLDVRAVRAGAAAVIEALMRAPGPRGFAPAEGAAIAVALAQERGLKTHVMMPYSDRLARFTHWFAQLWAESLGKNAKGTTPVPCLGPLSQHSQLQLFMDGPREHLITIVRVPTHGRGPRLPSELAIGGGVDYLAGKTIGDLVAAQAHAVPEALARAGRPVRIIDLKQLDERALGALMMHFMIETILAARLLGVNPFDQPAVELAKELTRERLSPRAS
jgi:glucose-6-phosphate isomerase